LISLNILSPNARNARVASPHRGMRRVRWCDSPPRNGSSQEGWRNAGAEAQRIRETPVFSRGPILVFVDVFAVGGVIGRTAQQYAETAINSQCANSQSHIESFQSLSGFSEFAAKFPRGESPANSSVEA